MFDRNDRYFLLVIVTLSVAVQIIVFDSHPISISVDSFGYLKNNASLRPHGYDLFLIFLGSKLLGNVIVPIMFQLFMGALIPIILFLSFRRLNKFAAVFVSILYLFYTYPYVMSMQVMSESLFICGCALIIFFLTNYSIKQNSINLFLLLIFIFITNEVRQSVIIIYPAVLLTLLSIYFNLKSKLVLKHLAILSLIALVHINFGSLSIKFDYNKMGPLADNTIKVPGVDIHFNVHKNSRNIAPFFMIHYMSSLKFEKWNQHKSEDKDFFLSRYNGKRSKMFFDELVTLLHNKDFFYFMASDRDKTGGQTNIRKEFLNYSDDSIAKLANDIFYNTKMTAHRWPQLAQQMYNVNGYKKTGELLRGLIFEAILKNPMLFFEHYFSNIHRYLLVSSFHDELFYYFVPDEKEFLDYPKTLNLFPLSSSAYSMWVYQMDAVTGYENYKLNGKYAVKDWPYRDDYFYNIPGLKDIFLPLNKIKQSNSINAFSLNGNKLALPNYIFSSINRAFIILLIIFTPIFIFLSMFSKSKILGISVLISGVTIILLSCLISTGPRQICMFMIFFSPIYATGIDGFYKLYKKLKT